LLILNPVFILILNTIHIIIMPNQRHQKAQVMVLKVKKQWQKPELFILDRNDVNSGGVPNGVEGQLTPHASAPFTAGSIYHS
jgi:hypothetical protein